MKITLSKSQWEVIGKKAGWTKKASLTDLPMPLYDDVYEIEGQIENWIETYLRDEKDDMVANKTAKLIYEEIAAYCNAEAKGLEKTIGTYQQTPESQIE